MIVLQSAGALLLGIAIGVGVVATLAFTVKLLAWLML